MANIDRCNLILAPMVIASIKNFYVKASLTLAVGIQLVPSSLISNFTCSFRTIKKKLLRQVIISKQALLLANAISLSVTLEFVGMERYG